MGAEITVLRSSLNFLHISQIHYSFFSFVQQLFWFTVTLFIYLLEIPRPGFVSCSRVGELVVVFVYLCTVIWVFR